MTMRKLHLDKEIVKYRIHSDLVEIRQGKKKTLVRHSDLRDVIGAPQPACEICGNTDCWMSDRYIGKDITPSMVKSYVSIMTGLEQAKNRQLTNGPKMNG